MSDLANTTQIRLARRTPSYWRVTFDNPPLNIFGPETMPQLNEIVTALETDEDVKVVVFDSAVDGFFLTHYNFLAKPEDTTSLLPGPTGLSPLPDMLVRLSRAPVVSIASIRGRATGVGSELALASGAYTAGRTQPLPEPAYPDTKAVHTPVQLERHPSESLTQCIGNNLNPASVAPTQIVTVPPHDTLQAETAALPSTPEPPKPVGRHL